MFLLGCFRVISIVVLALCLFSNLPILEWPYPKLLRLQILDSSPLFPRFRVLWHPNSISSQSTCETGWICRCLSPQHVDFSFLHFCSYFQLLPDAFWGNPIVLSIHLVKHLNVFPSARHHTIEKEIFINKTFTKHMRPSWRKTIIISL